MGGLALVGFISGIYLDRYKGPRRILPLVHGLVNLTAVVLALSQIYTGWRVLSFMAS